ncbi:MAG: TonB-dependent receptor, partial [Proteobacteria bacterium]|nr:TonB-dependent receptor [Pseudomonadota bacterium]
AVGEGWAAFAETYYEFSDTLKFTLGLRYNEDHREDYGTNILFNSFDLNGALGGALGQTTHVRVSLADFIFGAPAGDQTALLNLYGVDATAIAAAEATGPASAERIGIAASLPPVPQAAESRRLTGSPTEFDFDAVSGRIGFDWQMSQDAMLYGFFSRGYKPGGLNPAIPIDFQNNSEFSYEEEEINAIEFGIKSSLLDGTMILNTAVYVYDYTGLQVTRIVNNSSINDNIDADIWGAELEIFWKPEAIQNLDLAFSYAYTNTEVVDSESIDPTNRTGGRADWVVLNNLGPGALTGVNFVAQDPAAILAAVPTCAGLGAAVPIPSLSYDNGIPALWARNCLDALGVATSDGLTTDLDGNQLPNTPEHAISFSAAYTWDVEAIAGAVTLRWDYYWQDDSFAREFNTKGDNIDSWDQHNMQLQYRSNDGKWSGKLFVRNLNDDDNVTGHYLTSDTSGFYRNYFLTEPRIYGLSVRYGFGE